MSKNIFLLHQPIDFFLRFNLGNLILFFAITKKALTSTRLNALASNAKLVREMTDPITKVINNGNIYSQRLTTNAVNAPEGIIRRAIFKSIFENFMSTFAFFFMRSILRNATIT